ncbi:MAG TPA: hypothetical protein VGF29_05840 [Hyphomicrobiaceae bacterium]|jgi:hypothetical protein
MPENQTPIAVEQLGQVFGGQAIGYHTVRCRHGGYLAVIDGAVHSAHATLAAAFDAMARHASAEYGEATEPPERARDVTPQADVRDEPLPGPRPRIVRPPETARLPDGGASLGGASLAERARTTAVALLALMAGVSQIVMGV